MSTTKRAEVGAAGAARSRPAWPEPRSAGLPVKFQQVVAGSGAELVNRVARSACGDGAEASPGAAEGMALVGRRAASLVDVAVNEPADVLDAGRAPWVYHYVVDGSDARVLVGAVELVANSHQSAVDLALAAHAVAERTGRPVSCRLDRALASSAGVARVPDEAGVAALLGTPSRKTLATAQAGKIARSEVAEATAEVLAEIGERLGRALDVTAASHLGDAEIGVVALGSAVAPARAAVARLRAAGRRVGLLALSQLRPLPKRALADLLGSASGLALVTWGGEDNGESELAEYLGELQAARTGSSVIALLDAAELDNAAAGTAAALAALLGTEAPPALKTVATPEPRIICRLAAQPGGNWGRTILLDLAAALGRAAPLTLDLELVPKAALLGLQSGAEETSERGAADLLLVPHPGLLDVDSLATALRSGAAVVIEAEANSDAELWAALDPKARAFIEGRELALWRVDACGAGRDAGQPARAARAVLVGAALGTMARSGQLDAIGDDPVGAIVAGWRGETAVAEHSAAHWIAEGARAVVRVDLSAARAGLVGLTAATGDPRLPSGPAAPSESWSRELRRFHLNGEHARGAGDPSLGLPLTPAALRPLREAGTIAAGYPYFLPDVSETAGAEPQPLLALLRTAAESEGELPILSERLPIVAGTVAARLRPGIETTPRGALAQARSAVLRRFDLSEEGSEALQAEVEALQAALPDAGKLVAFGQAAPLTLYLSTVRRARLPRLAKFEARARGLLESIKERLLTDRLNDPEAASPEAVTTAMGVGSDLFDAAALADVLRPPPGTERLSQAQRGRIEAARAVLADLLDRSPSRDVVTIVHSEPLPEVEGAAVRSVRHGKPLAAAVGVFDGLSAEWLDVFRALRVARLELASAYDPEVHDGLLADFGWSSCTSEELALLPPVLAIERGARVHRSELAAFKQVLDSGRPIHALIIERTPGQPGSWPGELGRTAVAHGEAFVLQSSVACPDHLVAGFARMGDLIRPAVAVVAQPPPHSTVPASILAVAALEGRATPCLRFDPDGGRDFADQIDLSGNPSVTQSWPSGVLALRGEPEALDTVFTWADVMALHDAQRSSFWVIPTEAWSDEQAELAELLVREDASGRRALPFIWVIGSDGALQRAVITRELMLRTIDRQRAWHALQELGGIDNAFARRAAEEARAQAEAAAQVQHAAIEKALRDEIDQARTEAAGEAMDRVVAALMNLDTSAASTLFAPAGPVAPAPVETPAEAPAAAVAPAEEEEDDDLGFDQPHIDSFLCTTCNECTGINPVMFEYNADKQAFITDPTTGTFAELVESAEKCPARCIHPGKPRAGDASATADMIERGATFG